MNPILSHFECSRCGKTYTFHECFRLCEECERPLLARYDFDRLGFVTPRTFARKGQGMWMWRDLLPFSVSSEIVSLGEGGTPLIPSRNNPHLLFKDEGQNPTGSFKARGMSMAVSGARALGAKELYAPSAGNAGVALAAYGARAGLPVTLAFPEGTPPVIVSRAKDYGATVSVVAGTIADAGKVIRKKFEGREGAFDLSTFREPFRVEGKKTMGFELFDQFNGSLPSAVIYPAGGGTGLVALAKAMDEMEYLGWLGKDRMRLFIVQALGCCPLVKAYEQNSEFGITPERPGTQAHGLCVPSTLADFLILKAIEETGGGALAVTEKEMERAQEYFAMEEGLLVAPEAAATLAAAEKLYAGGDLRQDEEVVLFLTAHAGVY